MFSLNKQLLKDSFFDDINGKKLDLYQRQIVINTTKNILVVAGAGSGKTLTIIAKIKYLIEKKGFLPEEILCISFTNETVNNLINKINYNIDCFTFHKLALTILNKSHYLYHVASDSLLEYIVDEYLESIVYNQHLSQYVVGYFSLDIDLDEFKKKYFKEFVIYKKTLASFIKKIKTNNHSYKDICQYLEKNKHFNVCEREKNKCFLIIALSIYIEYMQELNSTLSIDFDDMLSLAINVVKEKKISLKYKYLIIDEYQDTSYLRYLLIKNIMEVTKATIMCVGDDYQSIYGFSGCDIDLFVNFSKYFDNAKIMHMHNVYRNSYEIISTSSSFIRKNKYQLKKKLQAHFMLYKPIILVYYEDIEQSFNNLIKYLYNNNQRKVLVLGRYNSDIAKQNNYLDMEIKYMTVHCSKGLEEDNVILLNMANNYLGFPSKIMDSKVFSLITKSKDNYPYAEERRLFYVALTRTKNNIYIMVPRKNPSIFISEIESKARELIVK